MEGQVNMNDKTLALGQCFFGEINRDDFADMTDFEIITQLYGIKFAYNNTFYKPDKLIDGIDGFKTYLENFEPSSAVKIFKKEINV